MGRTDVRPGFLRTNVMARMKGSPVTRKRIQRVEVLDPKPRGKDQVQEIRNVVTNIILDGSVEMTRRAVRAVVEAGNITTLRYLWETAGLFPSEDQSENGEADSLAKILLERMGLTTDMPDARAEAEE